MVYAECMKRDIKYNYNLVSDFFSPASEAGFHIQLSLPQPTKGFVKTHSENQESAVHKTHSSLLPDPNKSSGGKNLIIHRKFQNPFPKLEFQPHPQFFPFISIFSQLSCNIAKFCVLATVYVICY